MVLVRPAFLRENEQKISQNYHRNSTISGDLFYKISQFSLLLDSLTLLHSERPKLYRVLAVLSAIGLKFQRKQLCYFLFFFSSSSWRKFFKRHPLWKGFLIQGSIQAVRKTIFLCPFKLNTLELTHIWY